jgi:hypothetical protein
VTRFPDVFERFRQHRPTAEEAGTLLGLSARHLLRRRHFETEGEDGLRDKRLGRVSNRHAPESERDRPRRLCRGEYADFTVKHFHQQLRGKSALQPNWKTVRCGKGERTTHALQRADIYTRQRQPRMCVQDAAAGMW